MNIFEILLRMCELLGTLWILIRLIKSVQGDDTQIPVLSIIALCFVLFQLFFLCFHIVRIIVRVISFICCMVQCILMMMCKSLAMMQHIFKWFCIAIGFYLVMGKSLGDTLVNVVHDHLASRPSRDNPTFMAMGLVASSVCMELDSQNLLQLRQPFRHLSQNCLGRFFRLVVCGNAVVEVLQPNCVLHELAIQTKLYDVVKSCQEEYLQDDNHDLTWLWTCVMNR